MTASFASGLGGFIVYFFGTNVTFILDSITYLFSAFCILQLFRLGISGNSIEKNESQVIDSNNLEIFWLSFTRGFCSLVFGSLSVSHIAYLKSEKSLSSPALIIGIYFTVIGISVFLGPVIMEKYADQSPKGIQCWIVLGFFIQSIGTLIASFSFHFLWMIFFGAFFRPIGEAFVFTLGTTYLQRSVPDEIRGRIFAFSSAFFQFSWFFVIMFWIID
eukprot:gene10031-2350_t